VLTRGATIENLHDAPRPTTIWYLWAGVIALALVALAGRLLNFSLLSEQFSGPEWLAEILWWQILIPLAGPAFATVGALIVSRRPENRVGWLSFGLGGIVVLQDIIWQYAIRALTLEPGSLPFGTVAGLLANISGPPVVVVVALILLLFPTGHLVSGRWRVVLWLSVGMLVVNAVSGLFISSVGVTVDATTQNPLAFEPVASVAGVIHGFVQLFIPLPLLLAIVSNVLRWRGARGIERQQLKWIAYVGALMGVGLCAGIGAVLLTGYSYLMLVPFSVAIAAFTIGLPAAVGAAILRYGLLDIDVVINRILVYSGVTIILGAGYFGAVLGLQFLFGRLLGGQDLAIVVATLASVAAVRPVRDRIQRWVDRQFYRRVYDTATMLALLGRSAREEVDLDRLQTIISDTICQSMQPRALWIWLPETRSSMGLAANLATASEARSRRRGSGSRD
jgi:hypothetical protein